MLVRNLSHQLDCIYWIILSKRKEVVSEISTIFIAFLLLHMSSLSLSLYFCGREREKKIEQSVLNVKIFSNLNIFLFAHKFARFGGNETIAEDPRWTQQRQRSESSLEIKLVFSSSLPFFKWVWVYLFMHAWVAFSLEIFFLFWMRVASVQLIVEVQIF